MSGFALKLQGHSQVSTVLLWVYSPSGWEGAHQAPGITVTPAEALWGTVSLTSLGCFHSQHMRGWQLGKTVRIYTWKEENRDFLHLPSLPVDTRGACVVAPSASGHNAAEYYGLQGRQLYDFYRHHGIAPTLPGTFRIQDERRGKEHTHPTFCLRPCHPIACHYEIPRPWAFYKLLWLSSNQYHYSTLSPITWTTQWPPSRLLCLHSLFLHSPSY